MGIQRTVFSRLYRRTPSVEALPWHREEPPPLLERAVAERTERGRALDLGCGEGVNAVYLAQQGFSTVGIDFVPAALAAARARAEEAGVEVELREGDVVEYEAPAPFQLVLDSGCLHHLPKAKAVRYRAQLDRWIEPGGDYLLVHFVNRPRVWWIPMGPRHMTREDAVALFAPYELRAYDETEFDVPFPMGRMRAGVYWFVRPGA